LFFFRVSHTERWFLSFITKRRCAWLRDVGNIYEAFFFLLCCWLEQAYTFWLQTLKHAPPFPFHSHVFLWGSFPLPVHGFVMMLFIMMIVSWWLMNKHGNRRRKMICIFMHDLDRWFALHVLTLGLYYAMMMLMSFRDGRWEGRWTFCWLGRQAGNGINALNSVCAYGCDICRSMCSRDGHFTFWTFLPDICWRVIYILRWGYSHQWPRCFPSLMEMMCHCEPV